MSELRDWIECARRLRCSWVDQRIAGARRAVQGGVAGNDVMKALASPGGERPLSMKRMEQAMGMKPNGQGL